MPAQVQGAQGASSRGPGFRRPGHATPPIGRSPLPRLVASLLAAILVIGSQASLGALPAAADGTPAPLAVIIVGPSASLTQQNLQDAADVARQATDAGMRVRKVFHPKATWENVLDAIQGASLVVYLGHGNGWPSPHGPFQEDTKDGFGLDPHAGASAYDTAYYGADKLRKRVRLATDAVVLLLHLCYASGNGEEYMGPEFDKGLATKRADNFASGFLDIGARAVFAFGTDQKLDLPRALMNGDRTMDDLFESPNTDGRYDGFVGKDDYYRDSQRTGWARLHMDPHPREGHYRALTGQLGLTASEFRAGAGTLFDGAATRAPDTTAPVLRLQDGGTSLASATTLRFSPNGDGVTDLLRIRRTLSERASVRVVVRNSSGKVVRRFTRPGKRGTATITWGGRDDAGRIVRDGRYRLSFTPRDKAGNTGSTRAVSALVLTSAKALHQSRTAILASDKDSYASSTRIRFTLTQRAHVTWVVKDVRGRIVRTHLDDTLLSKGRKAWSWDGRDRQGRFAASGTYHVVMSVRTKAGVLRMARSVTVGAFRITTSDSTPARGQKLRIRAVSTEPLRRAPKVRISQPGHPDRIVSTRRVDGAFVATVRLPKGGKAGSLRIRVVGIDKGGQRQGTTRTLAIH